VVPAAPIDFRRPRSIASNAGGPGDDTLTGQWGHDYLDGGEGRDVINGGADSDTCINGEVITECGAGHGNRPGRDVTREVSRP